MSSVLVAARWRELVAREQPWADMPADDVPGCLFHLIRELTNEARDPMSERAVRALNVARDHGVFRRQQRCERSVVLADVRALRVAVDESMQRAGWPESLRADYSIIVTAQLNDVLQAAVIGWEDVLRPMPQVPGVVRRAS